MNVVRLWLTAAWFVAALAGGLAIRHAVLTVDPITVQLLAGVLWAAFCIVAYFGISLWVAKRNADKAMQNALDIAQAAAEADVAALKLFCIAAAVDDQTVPDARDFPSWREELLRLNGGMPSNIVRRLKLSGSPTLPGGVLRTLSVRQRRDLLELIDSYRPQRVR